MKLHDITSRVCGKCDDPEQTYVTPEYVFNFVAEAYEWVYGKLNLTGDAFNQKIVILPAVPGGSPDLINYQQPGGALEQMERPRMIRWRLPGQDNTYWRRADGPLDFVRDLPEAGYPYLDSWSWMRQSVELSDFNTALDLEVTGDFLFDPLTDPDSPIEISRLANRALSCKIASEVGKARGNDKWVATYSADADEAIDDLTIKLVKADQGIYNRIARMSRGNQGNHTNINLGR